MALLLFAVVVTWGIGWPVSKAILHFLPPLWATAIRTAIGSLALLVICLARGRLILPKRGDIPVILSIGLLHMVCFSGLAIFGMQHVTAGRTVVLAYTTPLWVVPGARLFLGEALTRMRLLGVGIGLAGLCLIFNPLTFDWHNRDAVLGNGLVMLAALCWAISILYVRAHRWVSPPFELCFWQTLLATAALTVLALCVEGRPHLHWHGELALMLGYTGIFGIALAYWAVALVNRALPAMTTSLGLLGVPVVGILCSTWLLHETFDAPLLGALSLIIAGIVIGTRPGLSRPAQGVSRPA